MESWRSVGEATYDAVVDIDASMMCPIISDMLIDGGTPPIALCSHLLNAFRWWKERRNFK